jgi:hypothetical protein
VRDGATAEVRLTLDVNQPAFADFSPDGRLLVVVTGRWGVEFWQLPGGQRLERLGRAFRDPQFPITSAAFAADGRRVLTSGFTLEPGVREPRFDVVWDPDRDVPGKRLRALMQAGGDRLRLSQDRQLVLVHGAGTVWVARWAEDRLVLRLATPERPLCRAALTPDGRRLVTAHLGDTVSLWDVAAGRELGRVAVAQRPDTIAVAPDGQALAAHANGVVTLWQFDRFFRSR